MKPLKHLPAAIALAACYTVFLATVAGFAINPGVGEGGHLDAATFRYTSGVMLDRYVLPVGSVPALPYLFFQEFLTCQGIMGLRVYPRICVPRVLGVLLLVAEVRKEGRTSQL